MEQGEEEEPEEEFKFDITQAEQAFGIQKEFERLQSLTSKMNAIVERSLTASTENTSLIANILNLEKDLKPKSIKQEKIKVKAPA